MPKRAESIEEKQAFEVIERYFDSDITDQTGVIDLLLDNGISAELAHKVAESIFPNERN